MSNKKEKRPLVESGILQAAQAIDSQIARAMQRSPEEREVRGVQKWEPHAERVEQIASLLVAEFGEEGVGLDALLVLSQGFAKALYILCSELGEDGLGELRTAYCRDAFEALLRDAERGLASVTASETPLN